MSMDKRTKEPLLILEPGVLVGRLTLLQKEPVVTGKRRRWVCRCQCGVEKSIEATRLRMNSVVSCGCFKVEQSILRHTKHGHAKSGAPSSAYVSWANMKDRCTRPKNKNYPEYGGKGITVCARWLLFENFLSDMGDPPSDGMTIERLDNSKGYQPGNCVWASRLAQANNRAMNWIVSSEGNDMTATQFASLHGLDSRKLRKHLAAGRRVFKGIAVQATPPYEGR